MMKEVSGEGTRHHRITAPETIGMGAVRCPHLTAGEVSSEGTRHHKLTAPDTTEPRLWWAYVLVRPHTSVDGDIRRV